MKALMKAVALMSLLVLFGCGTAPELHPSVEAAPTAKAEGDLTQLLTQQQETLNRMVSLQQSQATRLADRIEEVGELTQQVQTQMYDLGPRRAEFERERLHVEGALKGQMLGVLVGVLILAVAAPAIGGVWMYPLGIAVIVLALFGPKLLALFL